MRLFRGMLNKLKQLFRRERISEELFLELEETLVLADVGIHTAEKLVSRLKEAVRKGNCRTGDEAIELLKRTLVELLNAGGRNLNFGPIPPTVWLIIGVNGTGKTTTIAKLAWRLKREGRKPLLVAADTFRAAAIEQLKLLGERVGAPVIAHAIGADAAAVAYDGVEAAKARGYDVVLIDTAGRMHTRYNLLQELQKIWRVVGRSLGRPPDETLLVIDASTGQNAIAQAATFSSAIPVTGIILTKLDGTAKGGVVVAIKDQTQIPIKLVGVGESLDAIENFDPKEFVEGLFEEVTDSG
ncbi:MAG: signal recognition particle-docking protein FtsY [Armatimonadota bacterium]|nr:signal recognition particle-docking protein FtsY [Armatimonadota bacterium]MCX7776787.1 signal recognition particle-docking protein FtsY [Armatimonadota bacterium]MDW8024584.1 signal recognition particle-docking protein FtsY [Armatimonadota bacterium]